MAPGRPHDLLSGDPQILFRHLRNVLAGPLPGLDAHWPMIPPDRRTKIHQYEQLLSKSRPGAVLIMLFPKRGDVCFTLIRRKFRPGDVHSDQLGFPGGRLEPYDPNPLQAALRETLEEVGVAVSAHAVCGALSPVYIPPSNFLVQPYVAVLFEPPRFSPSPSEVEDILTPPLRLALEPSSKTFADFHTSYGILRNYPCYNLQGHLLWGASAMMLSELEWLLQHKPLQPNEGQ
ncbi:MAG: CoA pyrophosphatase [Flavobacteriales bacterium]|nr:CoA pyrophosphatase [Flavobacteriales bacterium]